jgi:DNA-binding NtrC family response regulator
MQRDLQLPTNGAGMGDHRQIAAALVSSGLVGVPLGILERAAIVTALEMHGDCRTRAAKSLGISVRTLQRKLKEFGVARPPALSPPLIKASSAG